MLTQNEINSLSLSPTKKDFAQIWNEILDVASKLSERWDPTSTNESDPGIVILKVLAGLADKLNYNIDKNTLEAFMPTAAQEDSMRKLCEMLGYNIKYYQSAKTEITIKYYNPEPEQDEDEVMTAGRLVIPKFMTITNSDQDINYFIIDDPIYNANAYISKAKPSKTFVCMEGQIIKCESSNDNNIITINQIANNNRFYLPETHIAENGIFIYNVFNAGDSLVDGTVWEKVDNLNVQVRGLRVYKFGFDSYEGRPYIEFPEDYSDLFNDGIFIYYARTNGAGGNISAKTLTRLELPTGGDWDKVSAESFSVENTFAATSGADIETIKQAYNNFKKTIGTFETLVTCRDYMNKIYSMTDAYGNSYVSNALVTDIRNDLNRSVIICSCDNSGIFYKETPLSTIVESKVKLNIPEATKEIIITANRPIFNSGKWYLGSMELAKTKLIPVDNDSFSISEDGEVGISEDNFYTITQNDKVFKTCLVAKETVTIPAEITEVSAESEQTAIDHFDLIIYPFKSYTQIKNNVRDIRKVYDASFTYDNTAFNRIKNELDQSSVKTIAHNIVPPRSANSKTSHIGDIVSINNYLRLNATIVTNAKVTTEEGSIIIDKIKIALANAFNMHELDFGEEIPFDSIVEVIENADPRIKVASINEPALYTTFSVLDTQEADGSYSTREYAVASDWLTAEEARTAYNIDTSSVDETDGLTYTGTFNTVEAKKIYNKLAVRNILAGRVPLFKYNKAFKSSFYESAYEIIKEAKTLPPSFVQPSESTPFTTFTYDNKNYVGQWLGTRDGEDIIEYAEIQDTSKAYKDGILDNINGKNITDIETVCEIGLDEGSSDTISKVTLGSGEFIKFRAPNFTTIKTYPAYVNYHLVLDTEYNDKAVGAKAYTLFSLLNNDRGQVSPEEQKWQKVLDYFERLDSTSNTNYVQSVTLKQKISAYTESLATSEELCKSGNSPTGYHVLDESTGKCKYCGVSMQKPSQGGPIIVTVDNTESDNSIERLTELLEISGCVKLTNSDFKARLIWTPSKDEIPPVTDGPDLDIKLNLLDTNPFIYNAEDISKITEAINTELSKLSAEDFPKDCSWTICYDFVGVPFKASSFNEWKRFIKSNTTNLLGFVPDLDNRDILFWRAFGEGYTEAKYILSNSSKLIEFDGRDFTSNNINNIYIAESLGKDSVPNYINNNEEYTLDEGEYLYIEYTPSTTTEDGTTQELSAVTEIYGAGTIIRPSGFEDGLYDSSVYKDLGNSPHKTVTFKSESGGIGTKVEMQKFGANEQLEIRDFAQVVLGKQKNQEKQTSFNNAVYYYKNFNNCPALEDLSNQTRTYTLQDGECIFYTDANKTEFAYFTTGTEVKLTGNAVLDTFDVIDLATIFESGVQSIPWKYKSFYGDDSIILQEYQYITLGDGDTLESLVLLNNDGESVDNLNADWRYCSHASYRLASSSTSDEPITIQPIVVNGRPGNGWEVCSTLELDVSSDNMQTLRNNGQVKTSIKVAATSAVGAGSTAQFVLGPELPNDPDISFKTNLKCQTDSTNINIDDIYTNTDKEPGFKFRLFSQDRPSIVSTAIGKIIPNKTSLLKWYGNPIAVKEKSDFWNFINLTDISPTKEKNTDIILNDNALRLPICVLPNTYGIFSIYLTYNGNENTDAGTFSTWIEGANKGDITILNTDSPYWEETENTTNGIYPEVSDKLFLNPGINCIRVNKNIKLFIKSSDNSQGGLYFDDLKLVDCKTIEYKDPLNTESKIIQKTTQGLNIEQLGYLAISDSLNNNILDSSMRNMLKDDYTNTALDLIDSEILKTEQDLVDLQSVLLEDDFSVKLEKLINFVKGAKDELTKEDRFNGLQGIALCKALKNYFNLSEALNDEQELLIALENDYKNIDALESKLAILYDTLVDDENKQQLITDIKSLETLAHNQIENVSTEEVLNDFKSNINEDGTLTSSVSISKLKELSEHKVEQNYNEQLALLTNEIETVANSDERSRLTSVLIALQEMLVADKRTKLLIEIRKLVSSLDNDSRINTLLDNVYTDTLAQEPDYVRILESLVNLRNYLESKDLQFIVDELEKAVDGATDESLVDLIDKLDSLLDDLQESSGGLKNVKDIIDVVEQYIKGTTTTIDIKDQVLALRNTFYTEYTGTNGILVEIKNELDSLLSNITSATDYTSTISMLQTSKDAQVKSILDRLKLIEDERNSKITNIVNFTAFISNEDYTNLPFSNDIILELWSTKFKDTLKTQIKINCNAIERAITDLSSLDVSTVFDDIDSLVYIKESFVKLVERATDFVNKSKQNAARQTLIQSISKLFPTPNKLSTAIQVIKESADLKTKLIRDLLITYSTSSDVDEKHRILAELKTELSSNIEIDTQLVNISAELLCPNVLLFDQKLLDESITVDDFYNKFKDSVQEKLDDLKETINNINTDIDLEDDTINIDDINNNINIEINSIIDNIINYFNSILCEGDAKLLEALSSDTISNLFDVYDLYKSVLPDKYIKVDGGTSVSGILADIFITIELREQLIKLKNTKIFDLLSISLYAKEELTKDNTYEWVDNNGNIVTERDGKVLDKHGKTIIELRRDRDGIWRYGYNENNEVIIKDANGWLDQDDNSIPDYDDILTTLLQELQYLEQATEITDEFKDAHTLLTIEELLLEDIRLLDTNRDFYYTAPVDVTMAIEFNESNSALNTLMNPRFNYDINNINNNFVISKLDIDYLDKGLQIARSSRLS